MTQESREHLSAIFAAERVATGNRLRIRFPADAVPSLMTYVSKSQEHFVVIALNGAHEVIRTRVVTKGTANRTVVHPREVFRGAVRDNAVAVVVAHNHPSGNTEPSVQDDEVTRKLKAAGDVLGITVLDHIIVGRFGYYSYLEEGRL